MKKVIFVLICFVLANVFLVGCTLKKDNVTIKYQRKLQKYLPADTTPEKRTVKTIDLSEGQKTKYDAKLGPQDLDFDIRIKDPY